MIDIAGVLIPASGVWAEGSGSVVGAGSPLLMWFLVGVGVLAGIWLTIFVRTRARQQARAVSQMARNGTSGPPVPRQSWTASRARR